MGTKRTKNSSKSKAKPKKKRRAKARSKGPSPRQKIIKRLALLSGFGLIILLLGSAYVQLSIAKILRQRAFASSAVVLSRPFTLTRGVQPELARVEQRLRRLRYSIIDREPTRPGQARFNSESIALFLREAVLPDGQRRSAQSLKLYLDKTGSITRIQNTKSKQQLKAAWIEPEVLAPLASSDRRAVTPTTINDASPWLIKSLIAIEDERFYSHFGIDPIAVARAIYINMRSGRLRQGGSTLTQQLAKNLFYGHQRTLTRKIKEAFAAICIETAFSKDEILEMYLNEIFLGQEGRVAIHGFGEAARSFFGKSASELSLSESATLVGIVRAPSYYSPRRHLKRALQRRNVVLDSLLKQKEITQAEYETAKDEKIEVQSSKQNRIIAPYFIDYLRATLQEATPLDALALQPLQIHSGIDVEYQRCAERAVTEGIQRLEKQYPKIKRQNQPLQAALVSVTQADGSFRAWVGGRDYKKNQFERISLALRQSGSVFKPVVYLTALDGDLNNYRVAKTTSLLVDEPLTLKQASGKVWEPQNYNRTFQGDVTLRQALVRSLNIPAVQLAQKVGVQNVANTARRLGIERELPLVPAIALGAASTTPLDIARAYATIANGGILTDFRPILAITKGRGSSELLFESPLRESRRASEAASFLLSDILISAVNYGTGRAVRAQGYKGAAAGKTGTTNDARDAWFAGYTPRLTTVVWVGYDDNAKVGLTGGQAAAPIWSSYMQCLSSMEPELSFIAPPGVTYKKIDIQTGQLATENCPESSIISELFVKGTEPKRRCSVHSHGSTRYADREAESTQQRGRIQRDGQPGQRRRSGLLGSILDNLWR